MLLLVATAMAQATDGSAGGQSPWSSIIMMVVMFGIFYFLLIRPQQKRQKEHETFVKSLERGSEIVTDSGLYGKIVALTDTVATIEIAPDVQIKIERQRIIRLRTAETSANS